MIKIRDTLIKIVEKICVFLFVLITLVGLYQVISRYFLNDPKAWSEEVLSNGFAWMALLASALVFGKRDHMRLTFIIDKFSLKNKKMIEIINEIIIFVFSLVIFVIGGMAIFNLTKAQITPALQWSTGVFYLAITISGILTCIFSMANIIEIYNAKELKDLGEEV